MIKLGDPAPGGGRYIPVQGFNVIVDNEDFDKIRAYKWRTHFSRSGVIEEFCRHKKSASGINKNMTIAAQILGRREGFLIDHKDGDPLNNRRSNLRHCSRADNARNRRKTVGAHRFKGVVYNRSTTKWRAQIQADRKRRWVGSSFLTAEEAAHAYDNAARRLHGEFACVNFPQPGEHGCLT